MSLPQTPDLPGSSAPWVVDPVFRYSRAGRLEVDYGEPLIAWRHLSSLVARDPADLEMHVRRILLAMQAPHQERLFGALIDLFLAVGAQCRELRALMLERSAAHLAEEEAGYLRAHLDAGLARQAVLPMGTGSVLDAAVVGQLQPVRFERAAVQVASRVEEAISLLDHGDLPAARELLEQVLLEEPGDETACRELLGIYRHSRDDVARARMQDLLLQRHGALPAAWA